MIAAFVVALTVPIDQGQNPENDASDTHEDQKQIKKRLDHVSASSVCVSPFFSIVLPLFAQARLQYFLGWLYSRLAWNSCPHTGQTAIRVDVQFAGFGNLWW